MRLAFRNVLLVGADLSGTALDSRLGDLVVEDGRIADVGPGSASRTGASTFIDIDCSRASARGGPLALMPAFIDLHAHFREPGFSEKETIESGCLAAAAGGFGTVVAMANTRPVTDDPALALAARRRAGALGLVDYLPAIATTRGLEGRDISHLDALDAFLSDARREGGGPDDHGGGWLHLISDDGRDCADDDTLLAAMRAAAGLGLLVACHCELGAAAPPPDRSQREWYASAEGMGADRAAELRGVERALRLAKEAGCRLHLCHLSTGEAIELVRREKARYTPGAGGFRLSCEVTPHHLALGAEDARAAGAAEAGRVNPWLREKADRLALLEGLRDGTIDAIATDHAPHARNDKTIAAAGAKAGMGAGAAAGAMAAAGVGPAPGARAAPGFSGLETAFALLYSVLCESPGPADAVAQGSIAEPSLRFDLATLSRLMSAAPASILGLRDRGRLEVGLRADLALVDPDARWTVDPTTFRSRGSNNLLVGRELRGRVLMTLHGGRIVYDQH